MVMPATIYDSSGSGDPVDLSGQTVTLKVYASNPADPVLNETIAVTDAAAGEVEWTVSQADITALDVNLNGYRAQLIVSSSGYVSPSYPFTLQVRQSA